MAAGMLRLAAARGDLPAMELLSQAQYFDPNAAIGGFTALHAACVEGQAGGCKRTSGTWAAGRAVVRGELCGDSVCAVVEAGSLLFKPACLPVAPHTEAGLALGSSTCLRRRCGVAVCQRRQCDGLEGGRVARHGAALCCKPGAPAACADPAGIQGRPRSQELPRCGAVV